MESCKWRYFQHPPFLASASRSLILMHLTTSLAKHASLSVNRRAKRERVDRKIHHWKWKVSLGHFWQNLLRILRFSVRILSLTLKYICCKMVICHFLFTFERKRVRLLLAGNFENECKGGGVCSQQSVDGEWYIYVTPFICLLQWSIYWCCMYINFVDGYIE